MSERHLIVTITEARKPHKVLKMVDHTNNSGSLDLMLSEIKTRLLADDAMLITILRDCHSEAVEQK